MAKKELTIKEKQLLSYRERQKGITAVYAAAVDKNGNKLVGIVDQFDGQRFNLNEAGHIMSEITALVRANSESEFQNILSRLHELAPTSPYAGMSDREMLQRVKPRLCQSPAEYNRFLEYVKGVDYEFYSSLIDDSSETPADSSAAVETPADSNPE